VLTSCDISVVVLAGGMGTRLRSRICDRPKVLAEVSGKPFLSFILDQLDSAGFHDVILATGYMSERIETTFGNEYGSTRLRYSREMEPLGTGGALLMALPLIGSEIVLVMNGDSFVDADLNDYLGWFQQKNREASLLLTNVQDTFRYGRVSVDDRGCILGFHEKGVSGPGWINSGVYLFERSAMESVTTAKALSLEMDFLPDQIGKEFFGYKNKGKFIDIGTPESYSTAEAFFSSS